MNHKHHFLISLILVSLLSACQTKKSVKHLQAPHVYSFPQDWIGTYSGKLNIWGIDTVKQEIRMTLQIQEKDSLDQYPWTIQYGEQDIRKYALQKIDPINGHYLIDEKNSIFLDAFVKGNHLISRFEVMGNDLVVDYERVNSGIKTLFFISKKDEIRTSGDQVNDTLDTIPAVNSYKITGLNEVLLHKID